MKDTNIFKIIPLPKNNFTQPLYYQIHSLVDCPELGISIGDVGGIVSENANVSNNVWIDKDSKVECSTTLDSINFGNFIKIKNSKLRESLIMGNSRIKNSQISGKSIITHSTVIDSIIISNDREYFNCSKSDISSSKIYGSLTVSECSTVHETKSDYSDAVITKSYVSKMTLGYKMFIKDSFLSNINCIGNNIKFTDFKYSNIYSTIDKVTLRFSDASFTNISDIMEFRNIPDKKGNVFYFYDRTKNNIHVILDSNINYSLSRFRRYTRGRKLLRMSMNMAVIKFGYKKECIKRSFSKIKSFFGV